MAEAHGEQVEAGAEHQHAIGLGDHASGGGMRERPDDAEIAGMAAEHVLAARRGDQQRADPIGQLLDRRLGAGAMRAQAGDDQRLAALAQQRRRPLRSPAAAARRAPARGRFGAAAVRLGEIHVGELDVDRQQQRRRPALQCCGGGIRQSPAGGGGAGRDEGPDAGGTEHAGGVEALVVGADPVGGARRHCRLAIDDQHARAGAAGIGRGVQPVRRGGPAADHRHAETAGAIGVALGHRDGVVLVSRAIEADAGTVERRGEDRRVVAHQAEHLLDAERLDVVDKHLIGRRSGHGDAPSELLAKRTTVERQTQEGTPCAESCSRATALSISRSFPTPRRDRARSCSR